MKLHSRVVGWAHEMKPKRIFSGVHALVFSRKAEALRGFFQDVLGFPSVDAGGGWLIFALPPAEIAFHPDRNRTRVELYLMSADLRATVKSLKRKGVRFEGGIDNRGWGLVATAKLPDGSTMGIYEPRHATAIRPATGRRRQRSRAR